MKLDYREFRGEGQKSRSQEVLTNIMCAENARILTLTCQQGFSRVQCTPDRPSKPVRHEVTNKLASMVANRGAMGVCVAGAQGEYVVLSSTTSAQK